MHIFKELSHDKLLPKANSKKYSKKIKSSGALLLKGAKFCDKTTTAKLYSKSEISLIISKNIKLIGADPKLHLMGENHV